MTLGVVFTRGVGLETWTELGILSREKSIYEAHLREHDVSEVVWFTYGERDREMRQRLPSSALDARIRVVPKPPGFPGRLGDLLYSVLLPIAQSREVARLDAIKTNQMDGSWAAVLCRIIWRIPLIVRTGYSVTRRHQAMGATLIRRVVYKLVERAAYRICDAAEFPSQGDLEHTVARYGIPRSRAHLVPNFVDTHLFRRTARPQQNRLVFVGALKEAKNVRNLILACARLRLGLDVYGTGPLERGLRRVALESQADIRFLGAVANDELAMTLSQYRVFVLPSVWEGMPKALIEAMACELTCVATDVDGSRELIVDGENGFLAAGTGVESLTHAMTRAQRARGLQIGRAARRATAARSLENVAARERALLRAILSR